MAVGCPPPSTLPCSLRPPASGRTRGRVRRSPRRIDASTHRKSEGKCNCDDRAQVHDDGEPQSTQRDLQASDFTSHVGTPHHAA